MGPCGSCGVAVQLADDDVLVRPEDLLTTLTPGYRAALAAYLCWGLSPLYWRLIGSVPPTQITAHRFVHVLAITAAVLWFRSRTSVAAVFRRDRSVAGLHLLAGSLLAVNWLTYVYAVDTERVLDASLGYFINPLMSIVLGLIVLGERIDRPTWVAIGVALVGVAILTVDAGRLPWISLVLAVTFAVYGLVKKRSPLGPFEGMAVEMTWMLPLVLGYFGWLATRGELDAGDGATPVFLLGLGAVTAVPLLLFAKGVKTVPLWAIGMMQFLAPSIQFLLGAVLFGEEVGPMRLLGFAVIWAGLVVFVVATFGRRKPVRQL